tara:strand:- start:34 stop:492 length:459 start_codon:yes stop_codon:yes gene_type:complete
MILKKLRVEKNWSQEQVAIFSGLSIRTIQRVESGQSASIETLKSIASVFEIDISKLTEEIKVIDKKSEHWKALHWFFRWNAYGIGSSKDLGRIELFLLFLAVVTTIESYFYPTETGFALLSMYVLYGWVVFVRYGDKNQAWDTHHNKPIKRD